MADLKLVYSSVKGEFEDAMEAKYKPIAIAATGAIQDAADIVKINGRADIAKALGTRFSNALRINVYPGKGRVSADASAYVFHRIPYAILFEEGGTVHGSPMLWIALPSAPKKIGREKITPALYISRIGKLAYVARPGHRPLLVANIRQSMRTARSGKTAFAAATLRRQGAAVSTPKRGTVVRSIPMFFGIPTVRIAARTHIRKICQGAREQLPVLYFKHLNPEA
jgi:hypothetical protein